MFDGFILMFGGQLMNDTNFQILLMGKVFPCLHVYHSTQMVSRMFDNIMGQTRNMRYVIHDG